MNTFDVLSPSLKVLGSHFLEASAGTGKTFAIEHFFVRLLLQPSPILVDEILVVTFTRAATRDLKKRIRHNIAQVLSYLKNETSCTLDYVLEVLDQGHEAVEKAKRALQNALIAFDEVNIFTIHGFCFRMLSEFSFEADTELLIEEDSNDEPTELVRDFLLDYLRTNSFIKEAHPIQVYLALRKYKNNFSDLVDAIQGLLSSETSLSKQRSFFEILEEAYAQVGQLKAYSQLDPLKVEEDFLKFISCYKDLTAPYYTSQVKALAHFLGSSNLDREQLMEEILLSKDLFFEKIVPENQKKKSKLPEQSQLHYPGLFDEVINNLAALFLELHDPLKNFFRLAELCLKEWKKNTRSQTVFGSDQLLTKMCRCLDNPAFFSKVSTKFQALIVDEFQDTDPLQWAIFEKLYFRENKAIKAKVLVGDPKQSIYSFRNADLLTYLRAKSYFSPFEIGVLNVNYRSDPSLIQGLNALFSSAAHPGWMEITGSREQISVPEIKASLSKQDTVFTDGKKSIHFFVAHGKAAAKRKWPSPDLEENYFFPFIAQEIAHLISTEGYLPNQIAILVKDRFQAQNIQYYLEQIGVKSSLARGQSLNDTGALSLVKIVLNLFKDPFDLNYIKQLLVSPFARASFESIRGGFENSLILNTAEKMEELRGAYFQKGIGFVLGAFLDIKLLEDQTVLETLIIHKEELLYQAYLQILDYLISYEAHHTQSLERILAHLEKLKKLDVDQNVLARVRHPEEHSKVQIMTTHISKGLEFDVVFALGLAYRYNANTEWIVSKNQVLTKEEHQEDIKLFTQAQNEEKLRQFYVAMTRAKRRVYVPLALDLSEESKEPSAPVELFLTKLISAHTKEAGLEGYYTALGHLEKSEVFSISYLKEPITPRRKLENSQLERDIQEPSPIKISFPSSRVFSFSYLTKKRKEIESEEKEAVLMEDGITIHTLPKGAFTGEVLHNIFERAFREKIFAYPYSLFLLETIEQEVKGTSLEEWKDPIFQMVSSILSRPLFQSRKSFSLSELDPEKIQVEMEFLFPFQRSYVKGFMDLVFEKDEQFYIVDWKSNWLGPCDENYSLERIEEEMRKSDYFLQAEIYAHTLKRYLDVFKKGLFEKKFAGVYYIFLRGGVIYHVNPDFVKLASQKFLEEKM